MKKFLAIMMAVLLVVLCFAGCTKEPTNENETNEANSNAAVEDNSKAADSDLDYVKAKGTLVVGITEYAPMDYKDENGKWIGFDAELAEAFAAKLGVKAEFLVLGDWDGKFTELKAKKIDCIWNGMTITDEARLNSSVSNAYVENKQVVVMAKDKIAQYADAESMKGLKFAVETGSAGESAGKDAGLTTVGVQDQAGALMEVASGTSDACIIDATMADAMTGEGTNYANLAPGLVLTEEEYGVSFRQDSDLTAELNKFLTEYDGLQALADKYNLVLVK